MKTIQVIIVSICMLIVSAGAHAEQRSFIGLWKYTAPDLPEEYSSGTVSFTEDNNSLGGSISTNGQVFTASNVSIDGDNAVMNFDADGNSMQFNFTKTETGIKGTTTIRDYFVEIHCTPFDVNELALGKWNYRIENVPEQYEKGSFEIFKTDDATIAADLIVPDQRIRTLNYKSAGTKISFELQLEQYTIPFAFNWKNGLLTGTIEVDGQQFTIMATRSLD
ncbi:MAG: hypothetical protein ACK5JU_02835 [Bacteroidales bacterium]